MPTTRVLITGSRDWRPTALADRVVGSLCRRHDFFVVVHGGCCGIDTTFADACSRAKVATESHPAAWEDFDIPGALIRTRADGSRYVANAGPIRNQKMVDLGANVCLAFHPDLNPKSGTADCIRRAIAAGIPT